MSMSSGSRTSSMFTMEETETLPSLMASAAMCEWQSIIPGITNCPEASITCAPVGALMDWPTSAILRSEEHTSELQSRLHLVCRLLLEKKKIQNARLIDNRHSLQRS